LLDGEKMAVVCRELGISRKTGYKILTRYNAIGLQGLTDRSRRPYRHANQLPGPRSRAVPPMPPAIGLLRYYHQEVA
jgi:leucine-zipper of insertion element IS481